MTPFIASLFLSSAAGVTFDPLNKAAYITLGAGNLQVTESVGSAWGSAKSTRSFTTELLYFEAQQLGGGNRGAIGVGNGSDPNTNYVGASATGAGFLDFNGVVEIASANQGSTTTWGFGSGRTACCAVNCTTRKIWFRTDSGAWVGGGDPAAGTGGISIAAITGPLFLMASAIRNGPDSIVLVNFGATPFSYTIPSGFSAPNAV